MSITVGLTSPKVLKFTWQSWRNCNRNQVQTFDDNLQDFHATENLRNVKSSSSVLSCLQASTYLRNDCKYKSTEGDGSEKRHKLVGILLELVVDWRRIKNRPDELAFGCGVASVDDDSEHLFGTEEASLDDFSAAEKCVTRVFLHVVDEIFLSRQRRLRDWHGFACQHRFVENAIAGQENCVALHCAA